MQIPIDREREISMIELGKIQKLVVQRTKSFGVYLGETGDESSSVLLPKKQVPEGTKPGDVLEVFIYKDSEDRLIATTGKPKLQVGEVALLQVKDVAKVGAFLDMGLEKDLLLPFKEQNHKVQEGEMCLVALYVDKSKRLAATMNVYSYMSAESPYKKDDRVTGIIYEINENLGAFVAVDNQYYGLIPKREMYGDFHPGDTVEVWVVKVRDDGKLDLSPRQKAYMQMDTDAHLVMKAVEEFGGVLPFNDKARPETILREMKMSKNAFKRAVGRLLKEGRIRITEKTIERI
jgi:predicted RNA-binding protein (virulence factor B family)